MRDMVELDINGLEEALSKLPNKKIYHGNNFTPEEDALILKYYKIKKTKDIAKVMKTSGDRVKARYLELTK